MSSGQAISLYDMAVSGVAHWLDNDGSKWKRQRRARRSGSTCANLSLSHSSNFPTLGLLPDSFPCCALVFSSLSPGDRRHSREVEEGRVRQAESGMGNCFTFPARSQSTPPDTRPSSPGMCYWIRKKKHISFFKRKKVTFFFFFLSWFGYGFPLFVHFPYLALCLCL